MVRNYYFCCLFPFICGGGCLHPPAHFAVTQNCTGEQCSPLHLHARLDVGGGVLDAPFWPRRGQCGGRRKSVKKNAALLHFLAFSLTDPLFGVPRGEQPLGRGPLPRNSGTFFVSFFGHKKGKPNGRSPLKRGGRRKVADPGSHQQKCKKGGAPANYDSPGIHSGSRPPQ